MVRAAAVGRRDGSDNLNLVAGLHAAAAADAAAEVANDHGGGVIQGMAVDGLIHTGDADPVLDGQVLKAAVAMGGADPIMPGLLHDPELTFAPDALGLVHNQAVVGPGGQQQLQDLFARRSNRRTVGENLHAGPGRRGAGRQQLITAGHLHHADAALPGGMNIFQMAEGGNDQIIASCHLQDGLPRFKRDGSIVEAECWH